MRPLVYELGPYLSLKQSHPSVAKKTMAAGPKIDQIPPPKGGERDALERAQKDDPVIKASTAAIRHLSNDRGVFTREGPMGRAARCTRVRSGWCPGKTLTRGFAAGAR